MAAIVFGLAASLPILILSKSFGETTLIRLAVDTIAVLGYLAVSAYMLSEFRLGSDESSRVRRIPVTAALIGGIGLVIPSLFLRTTDGVGLASPLGPVRRFNLAHPKLLIP